MIAAPIRTCVGCRRKTDVSRLERVTSVDGNLERGGSSSGRGAWVCSDDCFDTAVGTGALNRALRLNHRVRR